MKIIIGGIAVFCMDYLWLCFHTSIGNSLKVGKTRVVQSQQTAT